MAAAWMQILSPLTQWVTPLHLLKAMFAAVGAVGVWAVMSALTAVVPRGYAILFGIIYATSFGVWYFSSIEESKIVTASLSTLYIASYLQVRKRWTMRGVVLLTAILLFACLNEMVSGILVIIPVVDTFVRHGWDWRQGRWIAVHALAGPIAFVIVEGVLYGRLVAVSHPEGASHFSMLFFYISKNNYSLANLYSFVVNWLFFNIAAPTTDASYAVQLQGLSLQGLFRAGADELFLFSGISGCGCLVRHDNLWERAAAGSRRKLGQFGRHPFGPRGLHAAPCGVFFIFNPYEPLLFSPAVTLAHMLMIAIPLAASKLPAKHMLLGGFAALLFVTNGAFIIGR